MTPKDEWPLEEPTSTTTWLVKAEIVVSGEHKDRRETPPWSEMEAVLYIRRLGSWWADAIRDINNIGNGLTFEQEWIKVHRWLQLDSSNKR